MQPMLPVGLWKAARCTKLVGDSLALAAPAVELVEVVVCSPVVALADCERVD
jgi:hypothetical protein